MNRQLIWLDLCSGLGGASQPALDRGWRVIRVDIDPRFKPDIVGDVRHLPLRPFHIDVLWASIPCDDFCRFGLPASWACNRRRGGKTEPDMRLAYAFYCIRWLFRPPVWILENVRTARRFLTPLFGPVRAISGGHVLWGDIPCLIPQTNGHKWRLPPSPDRAALRAKIPYEIGEAICRAVERREGLE